MAISSYQTENVLKAYRKQNKGKREAPGQPDPTQDATDTDTVTPDSAHKTAYDKISSSLMDTLLKSKNNND
jgi:hypothetical protein